MRSKNDICNEFVSHEGVIQASSELVSLRLSPEEAFFLKFAVGSLTAVTAAGTLSAQVLI